MGAANELTPQNSYTRVDQETVYYVQNLRGDVVSLASEEFVGAGENRQRVEGRILETVRYTAFGVPQVFRRLAADIADDTGVPLDHGQRTLANVGNSGVNDGDYNAFFAADGFFYQSNQGAAAIGASCDIADDAGEPLSNGMPIGGATNSGVNEGDYNCFFNYFGDSRRVSTEQLYNSADPNSAGSTLYEYGELSFPENNNRIGYCGYWWDPHLQMYLVRNRWYTPREGRWLTPDPIGYAGGRNLYQYCDNQPWLYTDPMGLAPTDEYYENRAMRSALRRAAMTQEQRDAEDARSRRFGNYVVATAVSVPVAILLAPKAAAVATYWGLSGLTEYLFVGIVTAQVSDAAFQTTLIVLGEQQSYSIEQNLLAAAFGGLFAAAPALAEATFQGVKQVGHRFFGVFSKGGKQVEVELASAEVAALRKAASQADDAASATAGKSPTNPAGKSEPCGGCPDDPSLSAKSAPAVEEGVAAAAAAGDKGRASQKTIGLGIDSDLPNHRGSGAITYENGGWQKAGLTRVDAARAAMDSMYFKKSFEQAARNADAISFDVSGFHPTQFPDSITTWEFNTIISNPSLLHKTTFIRNGSVVKWSGTEFVP